MDRLYMDWTKMELTDRLSVHDEIWLIENEDGTRQATGVYSCGDLVDILDDERNRHERKT